MCQLSQSSNLFRLACRHVKKPDLIPQEQLWDVEKMGRLQPECGANKFRMSLLSVNGHVSMLCFKLEFSPLAPPWLLSGTRAWDRSSQDPGADSIKRYAESWRRYYHYHDVNGTRVVLFISQVLASALFSTCLTKLWDLRGPRAFREAKKSTSKWQTNS